MIAWQKKSSEWNGFWEGWKWFIFQRCHRNSHQIDQFIRGVLNIIHIREQYFFRLNPDFHLGFGCEYSFANGSPYTKYDKINTIWPILRFRSIAKKKPKKYGITQKDRDNQTWTIKIGLYIKKHQSSFIIHHIFTIPIAFVHRHDRYYSISHQFTCHRHFIQLFGLSTNWQMRCTLRIEQF